MQPPTDEAAHMRQHVAGVTFRAVQLLARLLRREGLGADVCVLSRNRHFLVRRGPEAVPAYAAATAAAAYWAPPPGADGAEATTRAVALGGACAFLLACQALPGASGAPLLAADFGVGPTWCGPCVVVPGLGRTVLPSWDQVPTTLRVRKLALTPPPTGLGLGGTGWMVELPLVGATVAGTPLPRLRSVGLPLTAAVARRLGLQQWGPGVAELAPDWPAVALVGADGLGA